MAVGVGVVAFVARLVPVLRGGGLLGLGNYDDGVYFAAAVGLAHGLVPYRDFLFLHPPGIVLLLWPFALLGAAVGSAEAFAVARVAFMVLGTANAVLVARLLREVGLAAAVIGGLCYALALPAVLIGHSTLLETPETTCLLLAVLLLRTSSGRGAWGGPWWSGLLLGASAGIKIWGVAVCVAVLVWAWPSIGGRRSLRIALGAVTGASLVCLPFLVLAGPAMWRMVVLDQLARGGSDAPVDQRVSDILGLTAWQPTLQGWSVPTLLTATVVLACMVLAWRRAAGRLAAVLLATITVLLLIVPSWYGHYAGLAAAPLALVVGAGAGVALQDARPRQRLTAVAVVVLALAGWAAPGAGGTFGRTFPAAELRAATQSGGGCVTSDDPTALVELGALDRNLVRGCPLIVDLSGYSYDLRTPGGPRLTRRQNAAWQRRALTYLSSGSTAVVVRFNHEFAFTARSARTVSSWPVVAQAGGISVQRP